MSFEEKYNRYKKSDQIHVSDDYVNEMAGKISEQIARKKRIPYSFVWIFSGATAVAICMIMVIYPQLNPVGHTDNPISQQTEQPNVSPTVENLKDSGSLASNSEIKKFESNDLDHDAIVEYLLDEEYEEI
jgi:hypothetical protein